jgi:hypothetical protein
LRFWAHDNPREAAQEVLKTVRTSGAVSVAQNRAS